MSTAPPRRRDDKPKHGARLAASGSADRERILDALHDVRGLGLCAAVSRSVCRVCECGNVRARQRARSIAASFPALLTDGQAVGIVSVQSPAERDGQRKQKCVYTEVYRYL